MKEENMLTQQWISLDGDIMGNCFPPSPCAVLQKLSEKYMHLGDQWKTKQKKPD